MLLLIPLLLTTLIVRFGAAWLVSRDRVWAKSWASWPGAAAAGMAVVFLFTGITHFLEPQRSGLEAIVPAFVPDPALAVTLSGLVEFVLAVGLVIPRTRRWAALAAVIFLLAVFPANVIASGQVSHPAAPTTPLLPRTLLQLVFIGFSSALLFRKSAASLDTPEETVVTQTS